MSSVGVLPSQNLRKMIVDKLIYSDTQIEVSQIQPSSLDLRLGKRAWRIQASFLTGKNFTVKEKLKNFKLFDFDLKEGVVFEKGCVYLAEIEESISLPSNIEGIANAKSSIGRLDILTRLITDYGKEFDRIPKGFSGKLYVEISPKSFPVLVKSGQKLNQIRLRVGKTVLSDDQLKKLTTKISIMDQIAVVDNGLSFSVDLSKNNENLIGYKAKSQTQIINLEKLNFYNILDFWEPLSSHKDSLILDPGAFYILVSKEEVYIPPNYAAEMIPYIPMVGEFRVHYAGFFDPGFGKVSNNIGSKGVLEVRCHETPFSLHHGQSVGRLIFEKMLEKPDVLYGKNLNSNYQGQKLKLSKHFKNQEAIFES